jgi:hypothetical protein
MLALINEHPTEAGDIAHQWTHPHRQAEVTNELLEVLMTKYPPDALDALDTLWEPPSYVRAMNRSSMLLLVTLEGLNNLQGCTITGLINSSATGRFINESLVEERGMEREPLPIPVPVYNPNGMLNKGGLITHVVRLRLTVQDHTEVFPLAITDTGKSDVIIGYNWLQKHNPEINWEKGELKFS